VIQVEPKGEFFSATNFHNGPKNQICLESSNGDDKDSMDLV
jgi:hypothetical protein